MAEWAHYSLPDAEWTQVLAIIGGLPPLFKSTDTPSDIPSRRVEINAYGRKTVEDADKRTLEDIKVDEKHISVFKPHGEIPIRIYTPDLKTPEETFPVLVDLHGSAFCVGDLDTDELKCRAACQKHRIVVVNVDYRLAPEFPWPIGIDDSYDAVKWVVIHAKELGVDLKKGFIINGLSAGAMFACIITQRARSDVDLKDKITGQLLQLPPTCLAGSDGYPEKYKNKLLSYNQNKDDPVLSSDVWKLAVEAYKAGPATHLDVSPLLAESLAGLPPAVIQVAGADQFRDDGLCYAERLQEDAVPVKLHVYPGVPHGFADVFPQLKISQKWRDDFDDGVQWLLRSRSQSLECR